MINEMLVAQEEWLLQYKGTIAQAKESLSNGSTKKPLELLDCLWYSLDKRRTPAPTDALHGAPLQRWSFPSEQLPLSERRPSWC